MADTFLAVAGLATAVVLSFSLGANNSAILVGGLAGSGSMPRRRALALTGLGMLAGSLLEGPKMAASPAYVASGFTDLDRAVFLLATLVLVVALTFSALPVSLTMAMVGALVGGALAGSFRVNYSGVWLIVAFWAVAPFLAGLASVAIQSGISRLAANRSLVAIDVLNRSGAVLSTLALAYALSANNLGLIFAVAPGAQGGPLFFPLLAGAAVLGAWALGGGRVAGSVGDRLLILSPQELMSAFLGSALVVWLGTQAALPISLTQCLIGAMLVTTLSKRLAVVNRRVFVQIVTSWVLVPLSALALAAVAIWLL
jgi:inorganic phosphate transporter, PiT family